MDTIGVARWNGLKILIPKHMWESKIRLLEQKLDENRWITFFLETPCTLSGIRFQYLGYVNVTFINNWVILGFKMMGGAKTEVQILIPVMTFSRHSFFNVSLMHFMHLILLIKITCLPSSFGAPTFKSKKYPLLELCQALGSLLQLIFAEGKWRWNAPVNFPPGGKMSWWWWVRNPLQFGYWWAPSLDWSQIKSWSSISKMESISNTKATFKVFLAAVTFFKIVFWHLLIFPVWVETKPQMLS